jgi:phosphatidylserine/phosphatidylglycerophosphate/cardiolipin synthase-like enzyme
MASHALWSHDGSYPPRQGNEVDILIDGQAAYKEISDAFNKAKEFIYLTISYCDDDFLLVPESGETLFDILRSRRKDGVDVRMVVWQPASNTVDTIPDKNPIPGVNDGPGCIQGRWDKAKGYSGWYRSPHGHFEPVYLEFPALLGCHHQKTYMMDDGEGGVVAFVGGINPVQSYWDTSIHDVLDKRRVERKKQDDVLKALEETPPLHDIFYRIRGPAVRDVIANFVERYNGASIPHKYALDAVIPAIANNIPPIPNGIELQVVRTIAPDTYPMLKDGERGIRELYLNMLAAAEKDDLVYIENQYFFDHGVVSEIHEAAERGAKIIVVLTSKPDEDTTIIQQMAEKILEMISRYEDIFPLVKGHQNVGIFTLGNSRSDPRDAGKVITSETYVHSKNMAVIGDYWAIMTGGSANIAFTSMWFHSEMNIAFTDIARIKDWVAQLWEEHLGISLEDALALIKKPDEALNSFKKQAEWNTAALTTGQTPKGRVYKKQGTVFPPRKLEGLI